MTWRRIRVQHPGVKCKNCGAHLGIHSEAYSNNYNGSHKASVRCPECYRRMWL